MEDKLLKPGEVCKRLNIDYDTLHALIDRQKLKATRLDAKLTRIYESSVDKLINDGLNVND